MDEYLLLITSVVLRVSSYVKFMVIKKVTCFLRYQYFDVLNAKNNATSFVSVNPGMILW